MKQKPEVNKDVEYLKALDESKDNTRISRYIFLLAAGFIAALFGTYFWSLADDNAESLLSSELIHFMAGAIFTGVNVIIDRYFKTGSQKESERDLTYLVGKLKQQEQAEQEGEQK